MSALLVLAALSFHFPVPEGWTDFSKGAPESELQKLPPEVAEDAQRAGRAAFAVDLRHVEENAVATFSASVLEGASDVDFVRANAIATGLIDMAGKKGEHLELVDAVPLVIAGQKAGRIRFTRPYRSDRMDVFVIPLKTQTAMLTFLAPIEKYEDYEPVFQKTAESSVVEDDAFTPALKVIAFAAVLLGAAVGFLLVRRRRKPASPPESPGASG